ncbi:hypothetical protein NW755_007417 [Fusarium falciforme]|uniref:Uncharacterized protein n=1 Tax=Fusarium falciforme TaxID=195108 RepID=A0A9W8R7Q9_9HYPO|nr:hypothetical protein NW755_007417 [Fusarium falciforme]
MDLWSYRSHGYGALEEQETDLLRHSHEEAQAKGLLSGSRALDLVTELVNRSRVMVQEKGLWGCIHEEAQERGLVNDIREEEQEMELLDRNREEEREMELLDRNREEEREMELLDRNRGEEQAMGPCDRIHEGGQAMVLVNGSLEEEEQAMGPSQPRACWVRRKHQNLVVLGVWESL